MRIDEGWCDSKSLLLFRPLAARSSSVKSSSKPIFVKYPSRTSPTLPHGFRSGQTPAFTHQNEPASVRVLPRSESNMAIHPKPMLVNHTFGDGQTEPATPEDDRREFSYSNVLTHEPN